MDKHKRLAKKGAELLIFGAMAGALIAGCGGGSGHATPPTPYSTPISSGTTPSGAATAVGAYIADQQGTSLVGTWTNTNTAGQAASATASTTSLATINATLFSIVRAPKSLSGAGLWSNTTSPGGYDLTSAGWVSSTNSSLFVDSGDGVNATVKYSNGAVVSSTYAQSAVAGATIFCHSPSGALVTCATPGMYPAGATEYIETRTVVAYTLSPIVTTPTSNAVTDVNGTAFPALPAVGVGVAVTFCDPATPAKVYQPMTIPSGGRNYNAYSTLSCAAADIATALGTPTLIASMLISVQATGNPSVPNVLYLSNANVGAPTWVNNSIYAVNAGAVWYGTTVPSGTQIPSWNKKAINAELVASGFKPIP